MREIKDYCDHCGKELNCMKDYGDTEIVVLTSFKADLCAECIVSLDEIALKFCKKGGAE
jgi:hypothetical protein